MALTAKQEKFAQCIAQGMTQADAYRASYDTSKSKNETIWSRASELMDDRKVSERVNELKGALAEKELWTREMSVKGLITAYKMANEDRNTSGMVNSVKELNAMHGYNEPTKIQVSSLMDVFKDAVRSSS